MDTLAETLSNAAFWAALLRIATPLVRGTLGVLLCERAGVDPRFTIDGNESMHTADHLAGWVRGLYTSPVADALRARLDVIEQPMYRDVALGAEAEAVRACGAPRVGVARRRVICPQAGDWFSTAARSAS